MIREATRYDIDVIVEMMRSYSALSPIKQLRTDHNEYHVRQLITAILVGAGKAWLAYKDNKPVGMLLSYRNGNMWNPNVMMLSELAFWVEPEHRHSTYGYRLLTEYDKYASKQLDSGSIAAYTISKLSNSEFDPSRRGFDWIESTYVKQIKE
jgi:N-acetylglutamate synthase-like GNAT family acetyltransferase